MAGSPRTDLILGNGTVIPEGEVRFATSRSSGPGGQNVNKVETRVTLVFDVDASTALRDDEKRRLHRALGSRISRAGLLRVASQRQRHELDEARRRKRRRPTAPSNAAERRRLEDKKRRARLKEQRRKPETL